MNFFVIDYHIVKNFLFEEFFLRIRELQFPGFYQLRHPSNIDLTVHNVVHSQKLLTIIISDVTFCFVDRILVLLRWVGHFVVNPIRVLVFNSFLRIVSILLCEKVWQIFVYSFKIFLAKNLLSTTSCKTVVIFCLYLSLHVLNIAYILRVCSIKHFFRPPFEPVHENERLIVKFVSYI